MIDQTEKHPISVGQATRDTLCWREHVEGKVCILPEGHNIKAVRKEGDPMDEVYPGEVKLYNNGTLKVTPISWNRVRIITLISVLSEFPEDATVDIYCDHYQGDFPIQNLEVNEEVKS